MEKSNLPRRMRIAALQCDFEGGREQTLSVPKLWNEFGFNTEQLFHTHGEAYTAIFRGAIHGDLVKEYLTREKENGIAVIVYMNCHILSGSQRDNLPEWGQIDKEGSYIKAYGTYFTPCLNSSWKEFFLDSLESLRGYDIGGVFFDGPSGSACFCKNCQGQFKETYGITIENGSEAQLEEFHRKSGLTFMKDTYEKVKNVDPDLLSYGNSGLMHCGVSSGELEEILSYNDLVGTEGGFQFYSPPRDVDIWRCGIHARMVEAVAGEKPKIIFMAGDHKPWSWYLHTPAETKLCYASTIANGCSVWYGIHCSTDNLKSNTGAAAREMVQFDKKHEDLYAQTESAADAAIMFSVDTGRSYRASGEKTDFYASGDSGSTDVIGNYTESFQGACGLLFRAGIAADVVTELNLDRLSRYSVIVAPTWACMSEESGNVIREYVRQGGVLITDSETSIYDKNLEKREDFLLSDMLGVSFSGYRSYQPHDYFVLEGASDIFSQEGVKRLPAPLNAVDVSVSDSCEVMARLCPPLDGRYSGKPEDPRYPLIVRNKFGTGTCYYFAGTFFELYRQYGIVHYKRLIEHLMERHSKPLVSLQGAPDSVEFTVRRSLSSRTVLVHLVNYSGGMTRPIDEVIPVKSIALRTTGAFASARALVSGRELELRSDGVVAVPEVREFEVVKLEE